MKTPESLETLVDHGIIQEVLRPLMSGKEAQVYVVLAGGDECVAKVYKEAKQRTFKHRAEYTEGRRTRNSRDQRAVSKRTRHGRKQDEAAWRSTEVDMIYRLRNAGVRVPRPINFIDGVLVMELVKDVHGDPAPRLGDLSFEAHEARGIYKKLIREVVGMLCAGVIHGDLSDFNVLMGVDGPVLIDFPQSVDPAHNQNARKLLLRDVENLHRFLASFAPDPPRKPYGQEMWSLYESNRLTPDTELRGDYRAPEGEANTEEVLTLIDDANFEEQLRRGTRGVQARPERPRRSAAEDRVPAKAPIANGGAAPKKRRRRRRRKSSAEAGVEASACASRNEGATTAKTVGSGEAKHPKRRRRRRRSRARARPEEAEAGARSGAKSARTRARTQEKGSNPGAQGRPAPRSATPPAVATARCGQASRSDPASGIPPQ